MPMIMIPSLASMTFVATRQIQRDVVLHGNAETSRRPDSLRALFRRGSLYVLMTFDSDLFPPCFVSKRGDSEDSVDDEASDSRDERRLDSHGQLLPLKRERRGVIDRKGRYDSLDIFPTILVLQLRIRVQPRGVLALQLLDRPLNLYISGRHCLSKSGRRWYWRDAMCSPSCSRSWESRSTSARGDGDWLMVWARESIIVCS